MTNPTFELDPPAREWASRIEYDPERHAVERAAIGLPADRPIVMAGHQGIFWHAGIAAKLFAAQALAEQIGGTVAWLVIDTDDDAPTDLRVPVRDEHDRLTERTIRVDRDTIDHPRATLAIEAFDRHAAEPSPGVRATLATMEQLPGPTPTLIRSSQLAGTAAFRALVELFKADAASARQAYNAATNSNPDAGMSPLLGDAVPFWRVTPSGARMPARETDLDSELWPRALATTGVVRASLCDLFIHGAGGRAYEPINDGWLGNMLGWDLAPFVTATTTLRLRFEGEAVSEAEAARAIWRAQHARHHPGLIGDDAAQRERDTIVERIANLPRGGRERGQLFAELHALLEQTQSTHAEALSELDALARRMRSRAAERTLRDDRTWPVVLHEPSDLESLRDAIRASFA